MKPRTVIFVNLANLGKPCLLVTTITIWIVLEIMPMPYWFVSEHTISLVLVLVLAHEQAFSTTY